jgi:hypothetical protein
MDATLYTGTNAPQNIVNATGFKPDLVWAKNRTTAGTYNGLSNSVRGVNKALFSNATDAESSAANNYVTSFNTNGFGVYQGSVFNALTGDNYVAWQWQAGQGTNTTNTSGTITSTVSVNTTAGFSIVTYTGNGSSSATVGHSLGVTPGLIITKHTDNSNWMVYHSSLPSGYNLRLNTTDAQVQLSGTISGGISTSPSSTTFGFTPGSSNVDNSNASGIPMVAYCWAPVAGFSQFGSYIGNASTDGPFVYLGFRPKFVMIKYASAAGVSWYTFDTTRTPYNVLGAYLSPDNTNTEASGTIFDALSNGFKLRTSGGLNASGVTFVYAAFAENPFKYANAF